MRADVRTSAGVLFRISCASSPVAAGRDVEIETIYGLDGLPVGVDVDGNAIVYPLAMPEGLDGVYSARLAIPNRGVYWARVLMDGLHWVVLILRVDGETITAYDATAGNLFDVALVAPPSSLSIEINIADSSGASAGLDADGIAIVWPQNMTQVPGYLDCWYFSEVQMSEGGTFQISFHPDSGPAYTDVLPVESPVSTSVSTAFYGWTPEAGLDPSKWVAISYVRKWTGWSIDHISDEDIRELRRMAIETFISETNCWAPGWTGTWHGLRGQGTSLYLPMPLVMPQNGGITPSVSLYEPWGDQDGVTTLDLSEVTFRADGQHTKVPYITLRGNWDHTLDIRIRATWGLASPLSGPSLRVKQVLVGLIRWHSLSLGVDADDARDQATLNRITRETTRDAAVAVHELAIGRGLTGDRTIDRALLEMRIEPQPWIRRYGDLPNGSY